MKKLPLTITETAMPISILAIVLACLYLPFINSPMFFDDLGMLRAGGESMTFYWRPLELRSLIYALFSWTYHLAPPEVFIAASRTLNLLIYISSSIILLKLLQLLFSATLSPTDQNLSQQQYWALLGVLIFTLNPVAMYAVGYLIQRTILLATLFSLLMLFCYCKGSINNQRNWLWASVPCFYFAVFSKEHAIMMPMVLIAITALLHPDWLEKLKQRKSLFIVLLVMMFLVVYFKSYLIGNVYEDNLSATSANVKNQNLHLLSILTQTKLFFEYITLWLHPSPSLLSVDMYRPFTPQVSLNTILWFSAYFVFGILSIFLILKRGKLGLLGLSLFFPWIMFCTEFSSVRAQEVFVLYRSYLWMPLIGCALPILLYRLPSKISWSLSIITAILLFTLSSERLNSMSHPILLWSDVVNKLADDADNFHIFRAYHNRSIEFNNSGQAALALSDNQQALKIFPNAPNAWVTRAAALAQLNQFPAALNSITKAIEFNKQMKPPIDPEQYFLRARIYIELGQNEQAQADLSVACPLLPSRCQVSK